MSVLLAAYLAMAAVMLAAWFFQRAVNNAGWGDVFWTFGTGAVCAACALAGPWPPTSRQWVVAGLAGLWSLRLGFHIFRRVVRGAEDSRFAEMRSSQGAKFQGQMLWVLQAQPPASAILAGSAFVAAHNPAPFGRAMDIIGLAVAAAALAGEAAADAQLSRFRSANHGGVADIGLWRWSRHPNYFFEWLGWLAYAPLAIGDGYPQGWLALAAPVLMFVLLNYVSGVPPLERSMLQSRGEAFRAYQARTSRFFPLPPKPERRSP
jgi:steroid 5-alpha reductase family enzyme